MQHSLHMHNCTLHHCNKSYGPPKQCSHSFLTNALHLVQPHLTHILQYSKQYNVAICTRTIGSSHYTPKLFLYTVYNCVASSYMFLTYTVLASTTLHMFTAQMIDLFIQLQHIAVFCYIFLYVLPFGLIGIAHVSFLN